MLHSANNRIWGILIVVAAGFGAATLGFLIWQERVVQSAWRDASLQIDAEAADRIADELQKHRLEVQRLSADELSRYLRGLGVSGGYELALLAADGRQLAASAAATHETSAANPAARDATAHALSHRLHQTHSEATRFGGMESHTVRSLAPDTGDAFAAVSLRRTRQFRGIASAIGLSMIPAAALFSLPAFALLALFLYRTWTRPLSQVLHAARVAAEGRSTAALSQPQHGELGVLAHTVARVQRRLRHQIDGLELQRDSLAELLNRMHEGVIVADSRGRIALINPAAARLLNLPLDGAGSTASMLGKPVERCIPQHDVQRLLHAGRDESARPGDYRSEAAPEDATFRVDLPDRTLEIIARAADLRLGASPTDSQSRVRSRFVVLTDSTELSEALQMKAEFVANASHELRTPLSTIRAAIETLQNMNWTEEPDDAARFLGLIDRHSSRLSDMVADLLDLSRIESPAVSHPAKRIVLRDFLDELAERFAEKLAGKNVRMQIDLIQQDASIVVSAYILQLALDNLVDNAIKFSPAGGEVQLRARLDGDGAAFEVVDHGCGIPEAEARRVFERFYQVERARGGGPQRGSGLGLAIVKHAAQVLGGSVRLASTVGVGTTVTLWTPLYPPATTSPEDADQGPKSETLPPERA